MMQPEPRSLPRLFTRLACALLAGMTAISAALFIYAARQWDVALPSFDVTQYGAFLLAAARGDMDWPSVWALHNDVHRIVLPKLVWVLDMRLDHGLGTVTRTVAGVALALTLALVSRLVWRLRDMQPEARGLLLALAALPMSSIFLGESLLSPINSQWALLALGLALLATGLAGHGALAWAGRVAGFAVAALSGGRWPVLLAAWGMAAWLVQAPLPMRRRASVLVSLVMLFPVWDILLRHVAGLSLLAWLYKPLVPAADWGALNERVLSSPLMALGWYWQKLVFFARYLLVPFPGPASGDAWLGWVSLAWLVLMLRSKNRWQPEDIPWVFLCMVSALLAVGAAIVRLDVAFYNYRHANVGMLLGLSSLVLLCRHATRRVPLQYAALAAIAYATTFMVYAVHETGIWSEGGRWPLAEKEIAHALGVRDPGYVKWVWDSPDMALMDAWREAGLGVFAGHGYRVYAGLEPMPAREVACRHRLLRQGHFTADARDWQLRGESVSETGDAMGSALFLQAGQPVGYAVYVLPSANLWEQWRKPVQWSGHALLDANAPQALEVVAYNDQFRCQPFAVTLP